MSSVLVVGEVQDGEVQAVTHELTATGRKLADAGGGSVAVALMGGEIESGLADGVIAHGADKVFLVEDPNLAGPGLDAPVAAIGKLCAHAGPDVILIGKTDTGRDLGPRLAYRLNAAIAQDCTDAWMEGDRVGATRPVYGGNAVAKVLFGTGDPQVLTMRPRAVEPLAADSGRTGDVESFSPGIDDSDVKVKVLDTVQEEAQGVRLEDASIVVSGGRGLGGPDPFNQLEELAGILDGALGASRAACDAGWLDHSHQVGLTGKTIAPDLYITVGISGASQHMAGCSGAKNLVAINRDEEANIFKDATLGVVGDWAKVFPAFMDQVKKLKAS